MFNTFNISASGLTAQRTRMDAISDNIANVNTTRTPEGGPYRRKMPVFNARQSEDRFSNMFRNKIGLSSTASRQGVEISEIAEDQAPFKTVYDPGHPDANEEGYVEKPNVNITMEMVDMIDASRAYEANVTALDTSKNMAMRALDIGGS
ncbi:MAG: flagellar basal body rod protein FlgC [Halarsenatibacteraceae bacterium]